MEKELYKKLMTRDMGILDCQIWYQGEAIALPKVCESAISFKPLFIHTKGRGVSVYYNWSDEAEDPSRLISYYSSFPSSLSELLKEFEGMFRRLRDLSSRKRPEDFEELFSLLVLVWPVIVISKIIGGVEDTSVDSELVAKCYAIRSKHENIFYTFSKSLYALVFLRIPRYLHRYANYLTFEEISSGTFPSSSALSARRSHYLLHHEKVISSLSSILEKHEIHFFEERSIAQELSKESLQTLSITGSVASTGSATGTARVIMELSELSTVQKGDILVTPMTSPDYLPAMQRAAAIVTDEGGLTCHAAITAREFDTPCIVGTETGTSLISTGDTITVSATDPDKGIIHISR